MKVYILIRKRFLIDGGVDYAAAIDNDEISIYKTREDAEIVRSRKFEYEKAFFANAIYKEETGEDFLSLTYKNGSRTIFEIVEKEIITNI